MKVAVAATICMAWQFFGTWRLSGSLPESLNRPPSYQEPFVQIHQERSSFLHCQLKRKIYWSRNMSERCFKLLPPGPAVVLLMTVCTTFLPCPYLEPLECMAWIHLRVHGTPTLCLCAWIQALFCFIFWDRISSIPKFPQPRHVDENVLELPILLPKCRIIGVPLCVGLLLYWESRQASCVVGRLSTNRALFQT